MHLASFATRFVKCRSSLRNTAAQRIVGSPWTDSQIFGNSVTEYSRRRGSGTGDGAATATMGAEAAPSARRVCAGRANLANSDSMIDWSAHDVCRARTQEATAGLDGTQFQEHVEK